MRLAPSTRARGRYARRTVAELETTILPRPPYSLALSALALSARLRSDATRVFRDGLLTLVFEAGGPALARVRQRPDGSLAVHLEARTPEPALERLRFVLAADDDHTPFLRRFERDSLLAEPVRRLCGLRPLRTATVTHALLKAVCGQLIEARAARRLEARLLHRATPRRDGLSLPRRGRRSAASPRPSCSARAWARARRRRSYNSPASGTSSGYARWRPRRPRAGSSASAGSDRGRPA